MPLIIYIEEEIYARLVAAIVSGILSLADDVPVTHGLENVIFKRPYDTFHFLTSFYYCSKEIVFEHRFRVRTESKIFLSWNCVDVFGILTLQQGERFMQFLTWW